jgi:cytochrome c oxidase subunit 2
VRADEAYIRESILTPNAKLVNGFGPIMPTFQGVVNEEQIVQIIAYIKSLGAQPAGAAGGPGPQGSPKPPVREPVK